MWLVTAWSDDSIFRIETVRSSLKLNHHFSIEYWFNEMPPCANWAYVWLLRNKIPIIINAEAPEQLHQFVLALSYKLKPLGDYHEWSEVYLSGDIAVHFADPNRLQSRENRIRIRVRSRTNIRVWMRMRTRIILTSNTNKCKWWRWWQSCRMAEELSNPGEASASRSRPDIWAHDL